MTFTISKFETLKFFESVWMKLKFGSQILKHQKQKSTMYLVTEWKLSIMLIKYHEISLGLQNFINFL
jgi:hypothetical protein